MNRFVFSIIMVAVNSLVCLPSLSYANDDIKYEQAVVDNEAGYRVLQKSFLTRSDLQSGGLFLVAHFENNQWAADVVTGKMPTRSSNSQEIFYISKDKSRWYLAIPNRLGQCTTEEKQTVEPYTVCNSAFGTFSGAGAFASVLVSLGTSMLLAKPTSIDSDRLTRAVYSVSEGNFDKLITDYRTTASRIQDEQRQAQKNQEDARAQQYAAEQQKKNIDDKNRVESWSKYVKGSEDSCKRILDNTYINQYDPESANINCQFGGAFNIKDLSKAGWLVVNKQRNKDGLVTEYYIRKAR